MVRAHACPLLVGLSLVVVMLAVVPRASGEVAPHAITRHASDRRGHSNALRARLALNHTDARRTLQEWEKRDTTYRFTEFPPGQGACGGWNTASDYIVALNAPQFDNGAHCYEMITIEYNGNSVQAQIVDELPSGAYGWLDLSPVVFEALAPISLGEIWGTWSFNNGEAVTTSSSSSTKSTPKPTPTTTSTSSTSTHLSTTHSTSSTLPTSSSSSSLRPSSTVTSSSTLTSSSISNPTGAATAIPDPDTDLLESLYSAILQLGDMVAVAAQQVALHTVDD